jgi:predicted dehydrogenase
MLRIGFVDPDTSHARAFAEILYKREDVLLTSVLNTSAMRDAGWIAAFANDYQLTLCDSLAAFAEEVDAALILSVDWEKHIGHAKALAQQDIIMLIDKPICGSFDDVQSFNALVDEFPYLLFAGSALPHLKAVERLSLSSTAADEITIYGPRDSFFMGIHCAELLTFMAQITSLTTVSSTPAETIIQVGGRKLRIASAEKWRLEIKDHERTNTLHLPEHDVYENYLKHFVGFALTDCPTNVRSSLNAIRIELAIVRSRRSGRPVELSELNSSDRIDPASFVSSYLPS